MTDIQRKFIRTIISDLKHYQDSNGLYHLERAINNIQKLKVGHRVIEKEISQDSQTR